MQVIGLYGHIGAYASAGNVVKVTVKEAKGDKVRRKLAGGGGSGGGWWWGGDEDAKQRSCGEVARPITGRKQGARAAPTPGRSAHTTC